MNIQKALSYPLRADEIDFRIQSINKGGYATILAYKDARVDINRLNEVFGVGNWQRKHERIGNGLFCSVGVKVDGEWSWVQDVGTPSNTEAVKGEASDSFKRACFNLGIGIELYDYPSIQVKLSQNEYTMQGDRVKQTWNLNLKRWRWFSQFSGNSLTYLAAKDEKGALRFEWGEYDKTITSPMVLGYELSNTIEVIKSSIGLGNMDAAKEAWSELTEAEKMGLWVAPSKGGVFSTEERQIIQNGFEV